ncbi:MAG: replicative DNA helicase [Chloroflexi bacterium]|nr:replicative DNA helicase [Chloroflexota bacterium]MCY3695933.1 replicative DNA helicase [Chloroflexota bacterium]
MVSSDPTYDEQAAAGRGNGRGRSAPRGVPQDQSAEEAVLGAILVEPGVYERLAGVLEPNDFMDPRHRTIFAAVLAVFERYEPIDQITVAAELSNQGRLQEAGGQAYLNELVYELPATVGAEHYARLVQRAATYRDMIRAAGEIGELAYQADPNVGESLTRAVELIYGIRGADRRQDFRILEDLLSDVLGEDGDTESGVDGPTRTGFADLDKLLNEGMHDSDLVVLAARPSVGKSALALTVARNAAIGQTLPVAIFSLEMSAEQVAARLVSSESRVEQSRLRLGRHTEEQGGRISQAIGLLSRAEIYIDDTAGQSLAEIRAKSRNLHTRLQERAHRRGEHRAGLGLIIVDHIQLVHGFARAQSDTNRVSEISLISRTLKEIARELQVPILALSQLSRAVERRHPPVPQLSDLRESGSIEQDADVVIFIYREDMYEREDYQDDLVSDASRMGDHEIAQLLVAKHRHGAVGRVDVRFVSTIAKFEDFYAQPEPGIDEF